MDGTEKKALTNLVNKISQEMEKDLNGEIDLKTESFPIFLYFCKKLILILEGERKETS